MSKLKLSVLAICVWGAQANAAHPQTRGEAADATSMNTLTAWAAHLNHYFPGVDVRVPASAANNSRDRARARYELELLEKHLRGELELPDGSLDVLACARNTCELARTAQM